MFVAERETHRVGGVVTRLEEVLRLPRRGLRHLGRAPRLETAVQSAVRTLELGHHEGREEGRVVAVGYRDALLARAGREHHHAVGGLRTVERGRRGTGQHRHVADVVGVERGDTVARGVRRTHDRIRSRRSGHRERRKRNAVEHVERVVVAVDRLRTAHHHLRLAAQTGRTRVDLHTGDTAREVVREAGVFGFEDLVRSDVLHVVRHGALGALDAECRHHHGLQLLVVLLERDVEHRAPADGHRLRHVADERHVERGTGDLRAPREGEDAVHAARGALHRPRDHDRGADDRLAALVDDAARKPVGVRRLTRLGTLEDDVRAVDRPLDARAAEQLAQHGAQIAAIKREGHVAGDVDVLVVVEEGVAALLFDLLDHRGDRRVGHIERDFFLILCECGNDRDGQSEAQRQRPIPQRRTEGRREGYANAISPPEFLGGKNFFHRFVELSWNSACVPDRMRFLIRHTGGRARSFRMFFRGSKVSFSKSWAGHLLVSVEVGR